MNSTRTELPYAKVAIKADLQELLLRHKDPSNFCQLEKRQVFEECISLLNIKKLQQTIINYDKPLGSPPPLGERFVQKIV